VRRRDVGAIADDFVDSVHEAPGEPLNLAFGEFGGVAANPTLGSAERNTDDGGLPGHELGECSDLVFVDIEVIAQSALERSAGVVVLDAIADERPDAPIVHTDRAFRFDLATGC